MVVECVMEEMLVQQVTELYDQISKLKSLKPSELVNSLFTKLVLTCMPPSPMDVSKLGKSASEMRSKLIRLCGEAEGLLESHYGAVLGSHEHPLDHLTLFPYYNNYLKLSRLEHTLLSQHVTRLPRLVAFVGSGPLPLSSIVLASDHLPHASFHNYDVDPRANSVASALLSGRPDLSSRMSFHTEDIMDVTGALKEYDVVFLAALVGMDREDKVRVVDHLATHMAPGALLMLRSAHGARAFLYPVIDPCNDLRGFDLLSVFHPADDVINSVVVARKHTHPLPLPLPLPLPTKCSDNFNPINHPVIIEELAFEE